MTGENGDYLSRFERIDKTLAGLTGRLDTLGGNLTVLSSRMDTLTRDVTTVHGTMKGLKENTDKLVTDSRFDRPHSF